MVLPALPAALLAFTLPNLARCDAPWSTNYTEYEKGGPAPYQSYKSYPGFSPLLNVDIWNETFVDNTAAYMFFTVGDGNGWGPIILDARDLSLVYIDKLHTAAHNTRIQKYKGEDYMTYWEGPSDHGHSDMGSCRMKDKNYEEVHAFEPPHPLLGIDLHECQFTDDGHVMFTMYNPIPYDLTPVGGNATGLLEDSMFQELDIETGEVVFEWRASDHIPITESYAACDACDAFEAYHINTLTKDHEGNYYISLRRIHAMVKVSGRDGSLIWQLGGERSSFTDLSAGHATDFAWQHHMTFTDPPHYTELTMFDNHNLHGEREFHCVGPSCSRGMRLRLDYDAMTVTLLQNYYSPTGLLSFAMGGYDTTPQGHALICWGDYAEVTEYGSDGVPVMNFQFGALTPESWMRTYRVYKSDWTAYPPWPPGIAWSNEEGGVWVWASWNGATEVAEWVLQGADEEEGLPGVKRVKGFQRWEKKGFECGVAVEVEFWKRFVRVVGVDKDGHVLGASAVLDMTTGKQTADKGSVVKL